jgi:peptide/nickel transport system permease protein
MLLLVILGPVLFPNPYPVVNPDPNLFLAPAGAVDHSNGHIFVLGSDRLGYDYMSLLLRATRLTLLVAIIPTIFALIVGFIVGGLAGFYGGWIDTILTQISDFMLSLPLLPVCIILVGYFQSQVPFFSQISHEWISILAALVFVFTLFGWMGVYRLVRGLVLSLRNENFMEAAHALGAGTPRILFRHLLPNASTVLLVAGTLAVSDFAILETILAYFGLGIHDQSDSTINSLGNLLAANSDMIWYVTDFNPFKDIRGYLILFPIIILLIFVLAINFISDALRDVLDPRFHA